VEKISASTWKSLSADVNPKEFHRNGRGKHMSVSVIYSPEALLHKNKGQEGKQSEPVQFASLELAKAAPIREGYAFGFVQAENGCYAYSKQFGWKPCSEPQQPSAIS
jgi:hypothetical protein